MLDNFSKTKLLVIDSYQASEDYTEGLGQIFDLVVYLDDLGKNLPVDLVVNSSCQAQRRKYDANHALCGLDYVILSEPYKHVDKTKQKKRKKSLVITMGGVDHFDISSQAIAMIEKIDTALQIDVVVGPFYENIKEIERAIRRSKASITVHRNLQNLYHIFSKNTFALSAGGGTIYELVATGTASIGVALWKNQNENVQCLGRAGAILPIHYIADNFESDLGNALRKLLFDESFSKQLSATSRSLVDGKGAQRIAKKIDELLLGTTQ